MVAFPDHYSPVVVGASAGLEGTFAIFALIHRDAILTLFFVLPVRAITLYYGLAAISVFFTVVPSNLGGGGVAHAAHLGGLLMGTLWVRQNWHQDYHPLPGALLWERLTNVFRRRRAPGLAKSRDGFSTRVETVQVARPRRVATPARGSDLSSEVDPILDKIAQHGMHSLTATERQKLDDVRRKMTGH